MFTDVFNLARSGPIELLKAEIEPFGKKAIEARDMHGKTPFHWAVEGGVLEVVDYFCTAWPECALQMTTSGANALHLTSQRVIVNRLLEAGVSTTQFDREGRTPILQALERGDHALVKVLHPKSFPLVPRPSYLIHPYAPILSECCRNGYVAHVAHILDVQHKRDGISLLPAIEGQPGQPNWPVIRFLLRCRDENDPLTDEMFPYHFIHGNREQVRSYLLEVIQRVGREVSCKRESKAIHIALTRHPDRQAAELIRFLGTRGFSLSEPDEGGITPLRLAATKSMLLALECLIPSASFSDRKWLSRYPALSALMIRQGVIPCLFDLYNSGGSYAIENAFREHPEYSDELNEKNSDGLTLLHVAVRDRNGSLINLLHELGADFNVYMPDGRVALHVAAESGWIGGVHALLEAGACPSLFDSEQRTPLEHALDSEQPIAIITLLLAKLPLLNRLDNRGHSVFLNILLQLYEKAISLDEKELIILQLLDQPDLNPRLSLPGVTPLIIAIKMGSLVLVQRLLALGVDINEPDDRGNTPLDIATTPSIIDYLQSQGATKRASPPWLKTKSRAIDRATLRRAPSPLLRRRIEAHSSSDDSSSSGPYSS